MDITGISMNTVVRVDLTPYGRSVYKAYMDAEAGPDKGPRDSEPTRVAHDVTRRSPQFIDSLELPLWELLRIFGPATRSSTRLPFDGVEVRLPKTSEHREALAKAASASASRDGAMGLLRRLAIGLGVASDFNAPEVAAHNLRIWSSSQPSRTPISTGWWWYGDRPVLIEGKDTASLMCRSGNGRRKPIDHNDPMWRGPAIRDARVKYPEEPQQAKPDEDIPF